MTAIQNADLFVRWEYFSDQDAQVRVLPDGCRDVIAVSNEAAGTFRMVITERDPGPRKVNLRGGTRIRGYRLMPGVDLAIDDLLSSLKHQELDESLVVSATIQDVDIIAATNALSHPNARISAVASSLGVSERTLQRRFREANLPAPVTWYCLGRARRAASALGRDESLAHISCELGYADQAHMTREFRRWFGFSPSQLRERTDLQDQLLQPGLGNWTAEQISTR